MDSVPLEVWSRIIAYASSDGYTWTSLLAVSHSVAEITKPYAFNCVALRNSRQIEKFAKMVEKRHDHISGMTHLFVNDEHLEEARSFKDVFRDENPFFRRYRQRKTLKARRCRDKFTYQCLATILSHVAPTLRTLKLCITSPWHTFPFAYHHPGCHAAVLPRLPALTALILDHRVLPQKCNTWESSLCWFCPDLPLPSLELLDISSLQSPLDEDEDEDEDEHPGKVYQHVASIAPSLTELRVPSYMAYPILHALHGSTIHHEYLGPPVGDMGKYMLPKSVRRVCVPLDMDHGTGRMGSFTCLRCFLTTYVGDADRRVCLHDAKDSEAAKRDLGDSFIEWMTSAVLMHA